MDSELLKKYFPELTKHLALQEELMAHASQHQFIKGTPILKEGAYVKFIPLVMDGLVKVYKEDDQGNEVLLYYIKPGESCIMSLSNCLNNEKSTVKAIIEEDASVLLLPAEQAQRLFQQFPLWNEFMIGLFKDKYNELLQIISILTFSNKERRLFEYLKKESRLKNAPTIQSTHQKIADELGSSREVISRLLKKMEKEQIVELGHGSIRLLREDL